MGEGIRRAIEEAYAIRAQDVRRMHKGFGTTNWIITDCHRGNLFVKQFDSASTIQQYGKAVEAMEYCRLAGCKIPKHLRTLNGDLCTTQEPYLVVSEFLDNTTSGNALNRTQMMNAGRELGLLHNVLSTYRTDSIPKTPSWVSEEGNGRRRKKVASLIELIERIPQKTPFDDISLAELRQKQAQIDGNLGVDELCRPLTTQVIHGDYSTHNLLFCSNDVRGIIDFRPPAPFLISWELGRIALDIQNLATRDDWIESSEALIHGYCQVNTTATLEDVKLSPRVWRTQLIRSTYGVWEHYNAPHERQEGLDWYWINRCAAARQIHAIESQLLSSYERIYTHYSDFRHH